MSGCPAPERIAAAAAGHDDAARAHVTACASCARTFADQRAVALALGALAPPVVHASRRAALANAVHVAARDVEVARDRRWLIAAGIGAGAIAAAAAIAFVVMPGSPTARVAVTPIATSRASAATPGVNAGASAASTHAARPAPTVANATPAAPIVAKVEHRGPKRAVAASDHVFGGSSQIAGERVEGGEAWQPTVSGFEWFRRGWTALRDGRDVDALAAFDRADAAEIASDAVFWAAVAAERAGHADARSRFERFIARFPDSEHVAAARAHLARF